MSWASRRRPNAWVAPSESSPLEVDRSSYATFTGSFPIKRKNGSLLELLKGRSYPLWTITSVAICAVLLYGSFHRDSSQDMYDTTPISVWDHNHYVSKDTIKYPRERNLLIAQIGQSRPFAEVTSRPNRAYARRWGWDYLLHTEQDENDSCDTVRVLNYVMGRQVREEEEEDRAPYDAVLFLSQDAVIMDLDYQFLALLPDDKLVATGESRSDLFLWNLNYHRSPDVAQLWLDLGDDAKCDTESLLAAIEMTMGDRDMSRYNQPLHLSDAGLVEPALIKYLPGNSDRNFADTMALLESVADSVCYRYYPRCEVL